MSDSSKQLDQVEPSTIIKRGRGRPKKTNVIRHKTIEEDLKEDLSNIVDLTISNDESLEESSDNKTKTIGHLESIEEEDQFNTMIQ
ncbi:hypothetical protein DdX_19393 [Ditylenchus destructor]|uniref:Uncharacterized protein n=1 Tax=Ditylenchus destructor TaxID=166010 RepID=A0AAD4MJ48_9BILA|nr:hypothetical protein DdX_19393 [Ditylenchus destructor]